MTTDSITIENVKFISSLTVNFTFTDDNIIVITGKNGVGKTSLIKSFRLMADPFIFTKSSGLNAIKENSCISLSINGYPKLSYKYNAKFKTLDTKDPIPSKNSVVAEMSVPYGSRFQQFSLISEHDSEIRTNIASSQYRIADELIAFLTEVYSTNKFDGLMVTKVKQHHFYFKLLDNDYYLREDHFSSGEFFLIQLFRLITSGASLILVDEVDVALDAAAQVRLYSAIKPILVKYNSRLILISHSLAFMSTMKSENLYYLEQLSDSVILEKRSFGYIKSDLYGFVGRDKYILVEDNVLEGFVRFLIRKHIKTFFEYEIISIGGEPQINSIIAKNNKDKIFGEPQDVIVVVDNDILGKIRSNGETVVCSSPVDDIEVFVYDNKDRLLPDVVINEFKAANSKKKTAKTYWSKVINSKIKTADELYDIVEKENMSNANKLIESLSSFLNLP